ncbi:hypothetical protein [Anabaena azotica]|uniref:Uncharacterized protein n=1 Tax=Anabaena azotica FACHB-119 TaxID=947527 RepID=A0ABR8DIA1_9NOST|nr:hypothetical protein [Anabaena azotica]MBD2505508.1 hypothetical protein [Anabaena azotica FACHB-119]
MESKETKKPYKPKKVETETPKFQHVKILDCNLPVNRVIFECWHCQQGLLCEVETLTTDLTEVSCPTCSKTAIRLSASKVLSTTPIPSPWQS